MRQSPKQLTLRGIPNDVFKELQQEAKRQKTSLNRVALRRIGTEGAKKGEGACADLLSQSGTWSDQRASDFEKATRGQRAIDKELWK